ncbi:MAG: hypothetical protein OHK0039_28840 [Bacteroidia bacterium]
MQELSQDGGTLQIDTGAITVFVGLNPYGISVQQNGQVITEDTYGRNLIWSNEAIANLKKSPQTESYFGFGEKAGQQVDKKANTLPFFNYDNFIYGSSAADGSLLVPGTPGPLNTCSPLYNSMPFALAVGKGSTSIAYTYGVFLDNVSQSFFNLGASDYSDMSGKYYFGALYGELDYYMMVGTRNDRTRNNLVADVVAQYSALMGPAAMPPMYAQGYHQGGYGYYDKNLLMQVAQAFRRNRIPIDGLHIDVDFQQNYRTFTVSPGKFGDPAQLFEALHDIGFKCSTNITGIISTNPMDENGRQPRRQGLRHSSLARDRSRLRQCQHRLPPAPPPGGRRVVGF